MSSDHLTMTLRPRVRVGCYDWEKQIARELSVAITVRGDWREAGRHDRLEAGFNYEPVCSRVLEFCEGGPFALVEAVAEGVARILCTEFEQDWVKVVATKRESLTALDSVDVSITRTSEDYG